MLERFGITDRRELAVLAGLILLVAITPLGEEATHPVILFIYRTLLLGIVAAYAAWTDRSKLQPLCPYFIGAVAAIFGIMILSMLRWDGALFESFYTFYENVLFIGAFIALAHAGTARPAGWKHAVLASVVLIDVIYLAAAMASGSRILQGPFVNPNYLASFVLPGIAICVATVSLGTSIVWRVAAAAAGVFLFFGIGQTSSRGATLAGLALLGLGGLRAARRYGFSWIRITAAAVLVAGLTMALIVAVSPGLVRKFMDRGERDPYNYQRGQIWLGTLSMIGQYPVTGVGPGHYYYIAKLFTPAVDGTVARYRKWPNIAHSEYLQYLAELGIPGALLLFGLGGYLLLLAWRRTRKVAPDKRIPQEAALLAAAGLGAHALVDNNWTVPVMAAGLAVISQADLLPYRGTAKFALPSSSSPPMWKSALALLLVVVWVEAAVIPSVGLYFNEAGHQAHNANDFKRAEGNHRLALAFIPEHPVLLDNLGTVYLDQFLKTRDQEHLDRAEVFFAEAMIQNPHFDIPAGHMESALIQRLTGDVKRDAPIHKRIVAADRQVLASNPFNPFIRRNLAEALYNLGQLEEACAELRKTVEIEPNYVPGHLRLAEWYKEMGRLEESDKSRKQAIQVATSYKDYSTVDEFEDLLLGRPHQTRTAKP
jgi:O-antigen ligase